MDSSVYRVLGYTLNHKWPIWNAIRVVPGIGRSRAMMVCGKLGLNPNALLESVEPQMPMIRRYLETNFVTKHEFDRTIGLNIMNKVNMGSYQGIRHQLALPVHGQRTRSHAVTQRKLGQLRAKKYGYHLLKRTVKTESPIPGQKSATPAAAASGSPAPAAKPAAGKDSAAAPARATAPAAKAGSTRK